MFSNVKKHFYSKPNENLNIRHVIKPLYIVMCLFGLSPYNIRFQKTKRNLTIIKKSIYFNSVCAVSYVLFMISFLAVHAQAVYLSIDDSTMTTEIMTQMNYILELVICLLFCIIVYFSAFRNRTMYVNAINKIGNLIEPPNIINNMNSAINRLKLQVRWGISILCIVGLLQFCVNITRNSSFWKKLLVFITFVLPQMIQFTWLAFFYILILMVLILLKNIREHISGLIRNKTEVLDYYVPLKSDVKILTLQSVESMYVKAAEVTREINKAFQASLLITTMQCFHSMVSEAHIIYHIVIIERDLTIHPIVNCTIWIGYQIIKIYVIARLGNLLKQQVTNIGKELHNIPTDKFDSRLLLEIQHFSTLISFQDYDMTAYGLFALDATLLSKVLASAAMYVIILVQFDSGKS